MCVLLVTSSIRRNRGRIHPINGHNNTVYEPDINPPPPATLYSQYTAATAGSDGLNQRPPAVASRNSTSPHELGFIRPPYFGGQAGPAGGSRPARFSPHGPHYMNR